MTNDIYMKGSWPPEAKIISGSRDYGLLKFAVISHIIFNLCVLLVKEEKPNEYKKPDLRLNH